MNTNKLEIVKMIGSREDSPEKLLERLKELERIIREKKEERECRFILSTMHASKGLEYDTVYLLDVVDGILPEKVLTSMNTASKEEIGAYGREASVLCRSNQGEESVKYICNGKTIQVL